MNIGFSSNINLTNTKDASKMDFSPNKAADTSIFGEREEFMGTKANTGLIDKMQTFFENLEKMDYDPRNSMFPGYRA